MKLVNIGFGNLVSANRMIAIVSPESAPIKRIIQDAKDYNILNTDNCGTTSAAFATPASLRAAAPPDIANSMIPELFSPI